MVRLLIKTEDILDLYNQGYFMRGVGRILDISFSCVKKRLKDIGVQSRFKHNYDYIIGQKFGHLTVLGVSASAGHKVYDCVCDHDDKTITQASSSQLRTGIKQSCGCVNHIKGDKNKCWKGFGEISSSKWTSIKSKTKITDRKFEISIEFAWDLFLKQNRKCALSGITIFFKNSKKEFTETTASLDRIDSNGDYTENNVQWVHKDVNWLKQDFEERYFLNMCHIISDYQRNKNAT